MPASARTEFVFLASASSPGEPSALLVHLARVQILPQPFVERGRRDSGELSRITPRAASQMYPPPHDFDTPSRRTIAGVGFSFAPDSRPSVLKMPRATTEVHADRRKGYVRPPLSSLFLAPTVSLPPDFQRGKVILTGALPPLCSFGTVLRPHRDDAGVVRSATDVLTVEDLMVR